MNTAIIDCRTGRTDVVELNPDQIATINRIRTDIAEAENAKVNDKQARERDLDTIVQEWRDSTD